MFNYAKTPTIFQMEATECGAASLSMIFTYFRKNIPLEKMRIETGVSRDGCNAGNLMRAAKKHGFECHGYRKELDELKKLKPPCIIHWNFNHFVVYEGIKFGFAYINDPATGRRRLTMDELDEGFTGVVLTFKRGKGFKKVKKQNQSIQGIKDRLNGKVGSIGRLLYVGLLLAFPGILLPVISQAFIDDILMGGNKEWFVQFMLFMGAAIILKAGLSFYRGFVLQKLQNKITLVSTYSFILHMLKLPMEFFDQRYGGDLSNRVDNNENVSAFLAGDLAETVLNVIIAIFYLIILMTYSVSLTFIGLSFLLVDLLIVKLFATTLSRISFKYQQDNGKFIGTLYSGLNITSTLKASGTENEFVGRLLGYYTKVIGTEQRLSKIQELINGLTETLGKLSDVVILMVGGLLVIRGEFTIGMLVAFTSLFDSFTEPIEKLTGFIKRIQSLKADIRRVSDIENYEIDSSFRKKVKNATYVKLDGDIEFKDVKFGYSKLKAPLIDDFNFHVHSGETIAFVGSSGSGKSTVSKLASGLYHSWEGEICYDGKRIEEIPQDIITASISTVSQNIILFAGTVRDNITMWNEHIREEDIVNAAKDACIHEVIMKKPGEYDYCLTENGDNLSGGQRQRLEIARALVNNPSILIMDEATSALDSIIEKNIIDNIKRRGCTCLVVAHRLSAVRDSDEIVVMENGKIVQRGTHQGLSQIEGHYKEFMRNI